ncbi:DHA2 family efflux MFS transporter permease subunit [Tumebacillus permanentifrigoris]|uniref:EmrB/QacA subfamily drug resistance transporter n=1 Tax=Tumebacillus permanentifrigoris TaxID=378543 RepID=A0A316D5S7_9BACL|nr:DHA2 family efflux MFS transporter permease subunit [Tumebacillus permanentifrigoris]PWK09596.1 EmrB/QacA subfamily drug resistance transporter [Tumebacillus permanentifrigoris]
MNTAYVIGYIVLSLLVLVVANRMMRSKKPAVEPEAPAVTVLRQPPVEELKTDDSYEPIPELTEDFIEAVEENVSAAPKEEVPVPTSIHANIVGEAEPEVSPEVKPETSAASKHNDVHVGRLLTVLLLGAFVAILNQTLINVALPHMMNDLNVSANVVQWLVTGYMLVSGVLIPITAYLIERYGARKLFLAAMFLFTLGAIICAISPNFGIMLFGRLVQASGAGIIMPLMMTVFLTVFPPEKRGKAMGLMGIAMIFAPAIGPTLSGYIVQNYTWRILFWIVIPIGLLDLGLAAAWMRNITKTSRPKFDFLGFLFSTVGFGGVLYGFSEAGSDGWTSFPVLSTLIIGTISLVLFVWRELTTEQPMLNLRVFKFDVFTLTTIISSLINMAMFAAMILLPIYLQNIRGFTPLQAGLLMLPGAILMGIMMPVSGAIFDKFGARALAVIGLIITVATTYEFTKLTSDTTYNTILVLYCLRMFGMSFMMMPIQTAGMNQLPRHLHAHGTATGNTARQVAGSLGTALLVTIMTNRATFHMASFTNEVTTANPLLAQKMSALGQGLAASTGLPASAGQTVATQMLYGNAMKLSTIQGINDAFLYATGFAMIALVLAFFIKRVKLQK